MYVSAICRPCLIRLRHQIHLPASIVDQCQSVMLRSNNYALVPKFVLEMRSVQLLDLSHNLLSALPHAFGNLTNIRTLNLCNNKFVAWPATTFAQTGITMLNLSQNKLEMIPREVGLFHTVLKSLNLSQNCIVNLPLAQSILTFVVSL
jgi:Leucine-rich repeat (LRR) protein